MDSQFLKYFTVKIIFQLLSWKIKWTDLVFCMKHTENKQTENQTVFMNRAANFCSYWLSRTIILFICNYLNTCWEELVATWKILKMFLIHRVGKSSVFSYGGTYLFSKNSVFFKLEDFLLISHILSINTI